MKSMMLVVICVAMALAGSGCRYEQSTRFKHMPGASDPGDQLKDHISYVTRGRLKPCNDEWRNVKHEVRKTDSPTEPYTATITAEVYDFTNATATQPSGRADYEISLVYKKNKWALKELKADSGPIGRDAWKSKGANTVITEGSTRWKTVSRELELP